MAANDRFYEIKLSNRPAFWGDLGNRLQISGLVLEGEDTQCIVLTPDSSITSLDSIEIITPDSGEWWDIIRVSDDPAIFELDETGGIKAVHRKVRYQISGVVQQKVWARDGFICRFCYRQMGEVQLTVDHFQPLELGGANDGSNYISACRKCNKRKGNKSPEDWCKEIDADYDEFVKYLRSAPPIK